MDITPVQLLQKLKDSPSRQLLLITIALAIGATVVALLRKREQSLQGIPLLGLEYGNERERTQKWYDDAGTLLQKGYDLYPKGLFQVSTPEGPTLIASRQFVEELKNQPDDVVSFNARGEKTMMPEYTGCSNENDLGVHVVKSDLTKNLTPVTLITNDEVEKSLAKELHEVTKDWTEVNIFSKMLRIVSAVSGRIFCEDLCHNEEWIQITIGYTMDVFGGALALKKWHPWLRPLIYKFFPQIQKIHAMKRRAVQLIGSVIDSRLRKEREEKGWEKPMDMLQWLLEKSIFDNGKPDVVHITDLELILGFASIHSNTGTLTNILYDMIARPEYIQPLRDEVLQALENNENQYSRRAVDSMWKLDSFMKESMRFTPTNLTMFKRTILQPVTLSNGVTLPAGTILEVPAGAMARDPHIVVGGDAEVFDGYRFYRARQAASREDAAKYLFSTISVDGGMHFGFGRRACPGRFFTTNLMKLILAHLLVEYEFVQPEAVADGGRGRLLFRYPNMKVEATNFVDQKRNLLFRKVAGV